jgi:hypothetical protein
MKADPQGQDKPFRQTRNPFVPQVATLESLV